MELRATEDGRIRINHAVLIRKLALRGKSPTALRNDARISWDTLRKIKRGEPVQNRILRKIVVQLDLWPELNDAADLLS